MGQGPTVIRLQLGRELKRLREAAGFTRDDAAKRLGRHYTWINRVEQGKLTPTRGEVEVLLNHYGLANGTDASDRVLEMVTQARKRPSVRVPDLLRTFAALEAEALEIWQWSTDLVPGLFQTRGYAEALFESGDPTRDPVRNQQLIDFRMGRQGRLEGPDPLRVRTVLDEAAIRRLVGGPTVMRDQLARLLELGDLPNISTQIVPFAAGAHSVQGNRFVVLRLPEPGHEVVHVEDLAGAEYYERDTQVRVFVDAFTRVSDVALDHASSMELIKEVAGRL